MSADLVESAEVSGTNSLREIVFFCGVLLVEIYSVSVALGGPFFEVGYFLLVIIGQTIAGAYIWASLRKADKIIPLPELLAMGFAIGSSSAAISQIFIRDLLGIRFFMSPLVPVICVAIWLVIRRNPNLPVRVTHANTNTLLCIIFVGPLALSYQSPFLLIIFAAPLASIFLISKFGIRLSKQILKPVIVFGLSLPIIILAFVLSIVFSLTSNLGSGLSRYAENDLRWDIANSIGFSNWGLRTNISWYDQPFTYYKLSHYWLGPMLQFSDRVQVEITNSIFLLTLTTLIGASLWAITFRLKPSTLAAGIASVIFFLQASIPKTYDLELRPVWLIGIFLCLCGGLITYTCLETKGSIGFILIFLTIFVIAGTRLSLLPLLIIFVPHCSLSKLRANFVRISLSATVGFGAALLFISGGVGQVTVLQQMRHDLKIFSSLAILIPIFIGKIVFVFIAIFKIQMNRAIKLYTILAIAIPSLFHLFAPRQYQNSRDYILPLVIFVTPTIALLLANSIEQTITTIRFGLYIFLPGFVTGICLRISYDIFKWKPNPDGQLVRRLTDKIVAGNLYLSILLIFSCLVFSLWFKMRSKQRQPNFQFFCFILLFCSGLAGAKVATVLSPITDEIRYSEAFFNKAGDSLTQRWQDEDRSKILDFASEISDIDDIFASNFGIYYKNGPDDDLRIPIYITRRMYLSAPFPIFTGSDQKSIELDSDLKLRLKTSISFPESPNDELLKNLQTKNVKWFIVDLERTLLRDWEPWAKTRYINEKIAILELLQSSRITN